MKYRLYDLQWYCRKHESTTCMCFFPQELFVETTDYLIDKSLDEDDSDRYRVFDEVAQTISDDEKNLDCYDFEELTTQEEEKKQCHIG